MSKFGSWIKSFRTVTKVAVISGLMIASFGVMGAAAQPGTQNSPSLNNSPNTTNTHASQANVESKNQPIVEVKSLTTTEVIAYTSSTIKDSTLTQGVSQTQIKGVNGILTHTYQVTYTDGIETSRSDATDSVTTAAVNEVISQGSKLDCPNGTYVNSSGNTVCSPYTSSTTPSGATAQCQDGTYSFSQSRRGTCSHHGGVSTWL